VMLYEVLSGTLPFDADTLPPLFVAICNEDPPPLSKVAPHIPVEISDVVATCLAKDPDKRPANASLLAKELGRIVDQRRAHGRLPDRTDIDHMVREAALKSTMRARNVQAIASPPTAVPDQAEALSAADLAPAAPPSPLPEVPDLVLEQPVRSNAPPPTAAVAQKRPAKITVNRDASAAARIHSSAPPRRPSAPRSVVVPTQSVQPAARMHDLGSRPILALFVVLAAGAAASMVGAETIVAQARMFPHYATIGLAAAAIAMAVVGVLLLLHFQLPGASPIGALLAGGGVVGYAAMLATAALQSAGAGLPNLAGVMAPFSLAAIGIGTLIVGASRAWDTWKNDRNALLSVMFVLAAIAGAGLTTHSAAAMLKLY
jgi:hypothetical protein